MKHPKKQSEEEKQFEKWYEKYVDEFYVFPEDNPDERESFRLAWSSALKWFKRTHCKIGTDCPEYGKKENP